MVHQILNLVQCHVIEPVSIKAWAKLSRDSGNLTLAWIELGTIPYSAYPLSLMWLNNQAFLLAGTHFKTDAAPPPSPHCLRFCKLLKGKSHHPFCNYISSAVLYLLYQHPDLLRYNPIDLKCQLLSRHPEVAFDGWQEVMHLKFVTPPDAPSSVNQVITYLAHWWNRGLPKSLATAGARYEHYLLNHA